MTHTQQKKILIVEDDPIYSRILQERLSAAGCDISLAHDGEEGLALALKNHPDIVLLDIVMPKLGGIGVLKKIREDAWGKNARVVILTNLPDNEAIADALSEGGFEYYVKADTEIESLVHKILD